jgi:putative iron-dependent peroxidase
MPPAQPGILAPIPQLARYLSFRLADAAAARDALSRLATEVDPAVSVIGVGRAAVLALGADIPGLRDLEVHTGPGIEVPSTPAALWCWLRGDDRGEILHRGRGIEAALAPAFRVQALIDAFRFDASRDLTGDEDGTENPTGEDAVAAAIVGGQGEGLDGGSFVAVQQWLHDLDGFAALPREEQDATFGRRRDDNEEIDDAPPSAHVKRTAQENFEPEAFVVRRSMPWAEGSRAGLVFVSFGYSLDAFDVQMRRMIGADDGITDALFRFTRPLTGAAFWCPPVSAAGRLDLRVLGI